MYPLKWKSKVLTIFYIFKKLVEILFMFESNGGCEIDNTFLGAHFSEHGIYFPKSYPDIQAQNGVVECKHQDLNEMACAFLVKS